MKKLFVLFAAATLFVGMEACKEKQETSDVDVEVTADDAGDVVEEVAEDVSEATDEVADAATDATEQVAEETHAE
ncbi:MAG: hypothetical protein H6553_05150 [Chitinophagales bacterium]|nr:hypothetical protein [Chitinophagales bacterium]